MFLGCIDANKNHQQHSDQDSYPQQHPVDKSSLFNDERRALYADVPSVLASIYLITAIMRRTKVSPTCTYQQLTVAKWLRAQRPRIFVASFKITLWSLRNIWQGSERFFLLFGVVAVVERAVGSGCIGRLRRFICLEVHVMDCGLRCCLKFLEVKLGNLVLRHLI